MLDVGGCVETCCLLQTVIVKSEIDSKQSVYFWADAKNTNTTVQTVATV